MADDKEMVIEEELLVPMEQYLSSGVYIGTKIRTKQMMPFVYKINPQGLSTLNLSEIDKRLRIVAKILSKYNPEDILVVCRRENGWKAVKAFGKYTGAKVFSGRYPAGVITNPALATFFEPKIILIADPYPDKNAVRDAQISGIPLVALCDTNNTLETVDYLIPCNNKGTKSLGIIFWILATQYLKEKNLLQKELSQDEFMGE
ncbi:MAG: 30S ribosomal protein S2 [DPANN group archaeon]|nr:30S ribosomal protein S2 [DPANN group archaeon]